MKINRNSIINRILYNFGLRIVETEHLFSHREALEFHLNVDEIKKINETANALYAEKMTRKSKPSQILGLIPSMGV